MLPVGYIGPESGAAGAKCACSGTQPDHGIDLQLEHVPPRFNQGDSRGAEDGRV